MSRKSPTLAEALAAGTKITLAPQFVASVVAARETSPEATARAEWIARNREKGPGPIHPVLQISDDRPNRERYSAYPARAGWCAARTTQLRAYVKMAQGLDAHEMLALVGTTPEERDAAWDLILEATSASRRCVATIDDEKARRARK